MDRMKLVALCSVCVVAVTQVAQSASLPHAEPSSRLAQWQSYIAGAAQQFGIPDAWIRRVIQAESGGRTTLHGKPITSAKGAMGLMQVMPDTYRDLRVQYGLGADAYDPRDNILAGAAYLRQMYERYGYPSLFAAYNAGPKRLDDFLLRGRSLPRETLAYVGNIAPGAEFAFTGASGTAPVHPIQTRNGGISSDTNPHSDGLFFVKNDGVSPSQSGSETPSQRTQDDRQAAAISPSRGATLFIPLSGGSR
jgi:Transglycosylase SLT domain